MKLVAVVLNWRDAPSTFACVESLKSDRAVQSIVVVDNESTGELREIRDETVVLIELAKNHGFAGGVNRGIREALALGADVILAINNDAVLHGQAATRLLEAWDTRSPGVGMIAPRIVNPDGTSQSTGGHFRAIDASSHDLLQGNVNYLTWACVLVSKETLAEIGLLDERFFMYWEDVDFGLRLGDAGIRIAVVDNAVVEHEKSRSHGRAGSKIERYSAHGLVLLCLKRGGLARIGMTYRVAGRLLSRVGNNSDVAAVLHGVADGVRAFRQPADAIRSL